MIQNAKRQAMHTRGAVKVHDIWPKHLTSFIERPVVEVNDAEILPHWLLPMRLFGQLPLKSIIGFEDCLIRLKSGFVHLLEEEVSKLIVVGGCWLFGT